MIFMFDCNTQGFLSCRLSLKEVKELGRNPSHPTDGISGCALIRAITLLAVRTWQLPAACILSMWADIGKKAVYRVIRNAGRTKSMLKKTSQGECGRRAVCFS